MTALKSALFGGLLTLVLAGCAVMPPKPAATPRGDYSYTREYITWLIRQEIAEKGVTGLSIALVDDQKVVWAEGFGYADKDKGVKASPETIYRAGSIAKLFTATAAMQLVDDGLLNMDKPLQHYLPEFTINSRFANAAPITPRTLLTHHSGLPGDLSKGMWAQSPASLAEEVRLLRDEYTAYPPDYVFSYSNVGMSLLGHSLEKIVDRDIASHLSIALFLPLRMTNSSFSPKIDRSPLASKAYRDNEEVVEPPLRDIPAGGLNTSVLDMSRFIAMIFGNGWYMDRQILKAESLAEMLRPQNSHVPLDFSFQVGLGWMLSSIGGLDIRNAGTVAHHSGATLYHRSQLIVLPEHKLGVVVLANSASAGSTVNKVAAETLKLALEAKTGITQSPMPKKTGEEPDTPESREKLRLALEARYGAAQQIPRHQGRKSGEEKRKPLTDADLQAYEGRYDTIAGLVQLRKKTGYLEAELFNRDVRLIPRPDGLLEMNYRFLGLFRVSLGELDQICIDREVVNGRNVLKAVIKDNEYLVGEWLQPATVPEKWQKRSGAYEIINADEEAVLAENIRLCHENGLLTVEYDLPLVTDQTISMALVPLSDTEAVIGGLGRGKGETVRVINRGKEEVLAYSGYLLRKKGE